MLRGINETRGLTGGNQIHWKKDKTTAILNNGESVIIGSNENENETTNQKVPSIGEYRIMGSLFRIWFNYYD